MSAPVATEPTSEINLLVQRLRDASENPSAVLSAVEYGTGILEKLDYLLIPEYDPIEPKPYPGNIRPGTHSPAKVIALLRRHCTHPAVVYFLADMLEE